LQNVIDVNTGEVKVSCAGDVLRSLALGSCIAVVAYDPLSGRGGIAHIMLPGSTPKKSRLASTFYAADAISQMFKYFTDEGINVRDIEVFLVGAANVLERDDDKICQANIDSVLQIMKKYGIKVSSCSLGGTERKRVYLDTASGSVFYSQGDKSDKIKLRKPSRSLEALPKS
jgi:chemotaxis protein CheD